jgi:hypothetical protein
MEKYIKVWIKTEEDLPKEAGHFIVCKRSGEIFRDYIYPKIDNSFPDANMWLKYIDWYLQPLSDQDLPSDEEIEEWIKADANWAKTFINGAIYGAKAMRDGLIKSYRK